MVLLSYTSFKIIPMIYLNSINRLVSLLGMKDFPCEIRNEVLYIYIIHMHIDLRKITHKVYMSCTPILRNVASRRWVSGLLDSQQMYHLHLQVFKVSMDLWILDEEGVGFKWPNNILEDRNPPLHPCENLKGRILVSCLQFFFPQLQNKNEAFCTQTVSLPPPVSANPHFTR